LGSFEEPPSELFDEPSEVFEAPSEEEDPPSPSRLEPDLELERLSVA
jgi:hypothetical protein